MRSVRSGKTPNDEQKPVKPITRELRRFIWLIHQFENEGFSQAEIGRRIGMKPDHLNRLVNAEKYGYTGLSAEIVRGVRDGLNISTDYFYDDYEPERPARQLYSLDQVRQQKVLADIVERLQKLEQSDHEKTAQLWELRAVNERKDAEIAKLRRELDQARVPRTRRTT
jgi:transcriptional regulator with XRE-family HTH domain